MAFPCHLPHVKEVVAAILPLAAGEPKLASPSAYRPVLSRERNRIRSERRIDSRKHSVYILTRLRSPHTLRGTSLLWFNKEYHSFTQNGGFFGECHAL